MNEVHDFDGCRLHSSTSDDHILVEVRGELDASNSSGVRSVLIGMLARTAHVVVDLQRLRFVDSSGLGALLQVAKTARRSSVRFEVVRPSAEAQRLIALTGMGELLGGEHPSSERTSADG